MLGESRKPPFKHSARTRVGFSDTDAQGIVYYGRYNPYFDLARVEYLRRLGLLHRREDGMDFVMRANTVEYFAPAVFDDEIEACAGPVAAPRPELRRPLHSCPHRIEDDVSTCQQEVSFRLEK